MIPSDSLSTHIDIARLVAFIVEGSPTTAEEYAHVLHVSIAETGVLMLS
jgi:hypothetical protein